LYDHRAFVVNKETGTLKLSLCLTKYQAGRRIHFLIKHYAKKMYWA